MRAVDTNVLARLILQDDEEQAAIARDILRDPVWVSLSVWVELGWVLSRRLGLERPLISDALSTILGLATVHVADRAGIAWAIDRFRAGSDWADMIHLVAAKGVADEFVTFDRGIASAASDSPIPVQTLA